MKKALAILTILALVAVTATAEITFGAWGRTMFVPIINSGASGTDSGAVICPSWGTNGGGRLGFTIAGNSDNVGFSIDIHGDGGKITEGDQGFMWVKPTDMIKISVGRVQDDTLRGNAAFGSFNWFRAYGAGTGEDVTFARVSTGSGGSATYDNKQGVVVNFAPTSSIVVIAALRDVNGDNTPSAGAGFRTQDLTKNMQIAAGYSIDKIGQIRAQYIADYNAVADDTQGTIQAAFKLTAVENLYADFGVSMTTNKDLDPAQTKVVSAYANYKVSGATVHALGIFTMQKSLDTAMQFGVGADYGLAGGIGLSGDIRYFPKVNAMTDATTTVFAGATKGFSNGLIGAGIEILNQADMGYAVPVRFEYWF